MKKAKIAQLAKSTEPIGATKRTDTGAFRAYRSDAFRFDAGSQILKLPQTYWAPISTLTTVLLVPRSEPAWQIAFHRFVDVSIGIAVALAMTVVWPEKDSTKAA